jgi:hypothetical protein
MNLCLKAFQELFCFKLQQIYATPENIVAVLLASLNDEHAAG